MPKKLGLGLGIRARRKSGMSDGSGRPYTLMGFGDSLSAYCGGAQPPYYLLDTNAWTINKTNPCTIDIPAGHGLGADGAVIKCDFWGFRGIAAINERYGQATTIISPTRIQLDGVDATGWPGTYVQYGRITASELASVARSSRSFFNNCNAMLDNGFDIPTRYMRGVPGDPASNFANRLEFELPNSITDIDGIHILGGRNDLNSGVPAATVFASLMAARDKVWQIKGPTFRIIMGTVCPNDMASNAIKTETIALNNLLRAAESEYLKIADYDTAVNDGSGNWKTNYPVPGEAALQHQGSAGGWAMGQVLKNTLLSLIGRGPGYILNPNNKLNNSALAGTGGSAAGITNNGFAPGWVAGLSGSGAAGTRILSKSVGDKQILSVNCPQGNGVNTFFIRQDIAAANMTVGDKYRAMIELKFLNFSGLGKVTEASLRLQSLGAPVVHAISPGQVSGSPIEPFLMDQMVAESAENSLIFITSDLTFLTGQTALRTSFTLRYDTTAGEVVFDVEVLNVQTFKV